MAYEEINTKLYEKMLDEQGKYKEWLLSQPSEEILHHAYEYVIREDIVFALEHRDIDEQQANALLSLENPVADIFKDYSKLETGYMDDIFEAVKFRANRLIRNKNIERTDER